MASRRRRGLLVPAVTAGPLPEGGVLSHPELVAPAVLVLPHQLVVPGSVHHRRGVVEPVLAPHPLDDLARLLPVGTFVGAGEDVRRQEGGLPVGVIRTPGAT